MARIPAPTRLGPMSRTALAVSRRMFGKQLEPSHVTAHHQGIFWRTLVHEAGLLRMRHRLPRTLRELVVHRVSVVIGCPWCIDFGAMLALRSGVTAEQLLAVRQRPAERDDAAPVVPHGDDGAVDPEGGGLCQARGDGNAQTLCV